MDAARPNAKRPKVLLTTVSIGAGHKSVAAALEPALTAAGLDVETVDVMERVPRVFRAYYAGGFATLMSKLPWLYAFGYWLTDRPHGPGRGLMERRRLWQERQFLRRFLRDVRRLRPDLVLHTHFVAAPHVGRLIAGGELDARQMVVVTDIRVHRFWHAEQVEHWFTPAEPSAATLRRWGIEDERITVAGIPLREKWSRPLDRKTIFADWKLPADKPLVVLTGGTEFLCGPVRRLARGILDACPGVHLIVLTGRADKLARQLEQFAEAGGRMSAVPFTDRVHELVETATLMVTKAGGVTAVECLAKAKPMVILKPVPGHEAGNAEYLADGGAAVVAKRNRDVPRLVADLLARPAELKRMADSAGRLHKPARDTVVQKVRAALGV